MLIMMGSALAGCLSPTLTICDDGIACSTTLVCAPAGGSCVKPEQIEACVDVDEGLACALPDGTTGSCSAQVCKVAHCGDSVLDVGEVCDDGNNIGGDGCNGSCTSTEVCGNGIVEYAEECDCGDAEHPGHASCAGMYNGEGRCSATCKIAYCGNGFIDPGEECDDGNFINSDTCLVSCRTAICGDGVVGAGELCDDADGDEYNGCMSNCQPCGPDVGQRASAWDITTETCLIVFDEGLYFREEAVDICAAHGGQLPHITSAVANTALAEIAFVAEQTQGGPFGVWLGVHFAIDEATGELTLQWMNGTPFVHGLSYQAWPYPPPEVEATLRQTAEGQGYYCTELIGETGLWEQSRCDGEPRLVACQLPQSTW